MACRYLDESGRGFPSCKSPSWKRSNNDRRVSPGKTGNGEHGHPPCYGNSSNCIHYYNDVVNVMRPSWDGNGQPSGYSGNTRHNQHNNNQNGNGKMGFSQVVTLIILAVIVFGVLKSCNIF